MRSSQKQIYYHPATGTIAGIFTSLTYSATVMEYIQQSMFCLFISMHNVKYDRFS